MLQPVLLIKYGPLAIVNAGWFSMVRYTSISLNGTSSSFRQKRFFLLTTESVEICLE